MVYPGHFIISLLLFLPHQNGFSKLGKPFLTVTAFPIPINFQTTSYFHMQWRTVTLHSVVCVGQGEVIRVILLRFMGTQALENQSHLNVRHLVPMRKAFSLLTPQSSTISNLQVSLVNKTSTLTVPIHNYFYPSCSPIQEELSACPSQLLFFMDASFLPLPLLFPKPDNSIHTVHHSSTFCGLDALELEFEMILFRDHFVDQIQPSTIVSIFGKNYAPTSDLLILKIR